jgi:cell division protein FtsI/penicillin-binding protein 2
MKSKDFSRIKTVGSGLSLFSVLILVQMVRIQVIDSGRKLSEEGTRLYESQTEIIYPERGSIYDRYGNVLATNREVYEIGVNFQYVTDPETLTKELSSTLGMDYNEVHKVVSQKYKPGETVYATIANFVGTDKVDELQAKAKQYKAQASGKRLRKGEIAANMDGLEFRSRLIRSYPEKTLAANILGFIFYGDMQNAQPIFGVEQYYNELLAGTPVEYKYYFDPNKASKEPYVPPGDSLVLTIDRQIQIEVEKILDDSVKKNGAESGTIIVLDPKTGEILAMATTPRLDPNQYWTLQDTFKDSTPYNRAIGQTYEPGSVFKVVTMASALDNGTVTPDTEFIDTGVFNYGGYSIYNWDRGAWGKQNMMTCMEHSLNVCLSWISTSMGAGPFYDYLKAFGIGRKSNVDLAGETSFPLSVPADGNWFDINLATNSFGQGLAVTPLELASAISAVANDGKIMTPHVVKSVISNGHQRDITPTVSSTPIKPETAHTLTEMLAQSLEGESSDAMVDGYRVAGKTGTGEIPSPEGYLSNLTNASFVGWGPVDDPKFLVYVWLEKPTSSIWGSIVAAPVFSEVTAKLVTLMNIPPDDVRQQLNNGN